VTALDCVHLLGLALGTIGVGVMILLGPSIYAGVLIVAGAALAIATHTDERHGP
jgi:hypothetical protein